MVTVFIYAHKDILAALAFNMVLQNEVGPVPDKLYSHLIHANVWLQHHPISEPTVSILKSGYTTYEDTANGIRLLCARLCKHIEQIDPEVSIDYDALGHNVAEEVLRMNAQYKKEVKYEKVYKGLL